MKPAYEPDNTRSSIVILMSLAIIVSVVTVLIGLSDKPDVSRIAVFAGESQAAAASSPNFGFDSGDEALGGDTALQESGTTGDADLGSDAATAGTGDTETQREPVGEVIVIPTAAEPTPTPEIAAAVEPTPIPDETQTQAEATGDVITAPALPSTTGVVQGTFFTKGDENEGAQVAQNVITVAFSEDGSGDFQGVLDITYADGTHILLNMSGPLTWAPTNPQVETVLAGAFTLDAPIDADDITGDDAELIITSLSAGSGSLCTSKCFGFTFPPP